MRMLRLAVPVAGGLAAAAVWAAVPAAATSGAHYMPGTAASVTDAGALSVAVDEAGVGQAQVDYALTWSAAADYGCLNGGGNHPQAANKETVVTSGSQSFSESPVNGRVQATVTAGGTPPPPAGFTCPSGQVLVLADVTYDPVTLDDTTNGASITLAASRVFYTFR